MSEILRKVENDDGVVERLMFFCPGCNMVHGVTIIGDYKWGFNEDYEKPTFSPSILVTYNWAGVPKICHSFVENGNIRFLSDCTHDLANQVVAIGPFHYRV